MVAVPTHSVLSYSLPLDGIRGLAILLVMAHHFSIARSTQPLDADLLSLLHTGWVGVDLFFVLSGFLITGILIDARDSERYFVSFYARRTLRIIPLYYLIVFLSYHVLPHFPVWELRLVGQAPIPHEQYFWSFLANFVFAEQDQLQHGILNRRRHIRNLSLTERCQRELACLIVIRGEGGTTHIIPLLGCTGGRAGYALGVQVGGEIRLGWKQRFSTRDMLSINGVSLNRKALRRKRVADERVVMI